MKTLLTECSKNRAEWLELRGTGVTASDVPTVLGLNPWKTRYALWQEKRRAKEGLFDEFDNESMYWGRKLEAPVAEAVAERLEAELSAPDCLYGHDSLPLLATPDRLLPGLIPVEIKTASERYKADWEQGLADYAHCQLAAQMIVLDAPRGVAAALIGGQKLFIHHIERDPILDGQISAAVEEFWHCVERNQPPALDAGDLDAVKAAHTEVIEEELDLGLAELALIETLHTTKKQISDLEKVKKMAEANLLEFLQTASRATSDRWQVERIKRKRDGYVVKPAEYVELKIRERKHG